jgi:hypothetical protein
MIVFRLYRLSRSSRLPQVRNGPLRTFSGIGQRSAINGKAAFAQVNG